MTTMNATRAKRTALTLLFLALDSSQTPTTRGSAAADYLEATTPPEDMLAELVSGSMDLTRALLDRWQAADPSVDAVEQLKATALKLAATDD